MSAPRVVLQARTTSTRLPAKALLPIAGMPSAVLAAKRAACDGLDLVFATSVDATDDALAAAAAVARLKVFRGSRDDVLGRYAAAVADLADEDLVIRVTGDDPVPDGDFLRALVAARAKRGVEMLFSLSPADGLPHGVAAQAFSVGALRRADRSARLDFEREHVGPWLVRNLTSAVFDDFAALDAGHLRCTLDTPDDYFDLRRLFEGIADPVGAPWRTLVERLWAQSPWQGMPFRFLRGKPGGDPGVERLGVLLPDLTGLDAADAGGAVAAIRHAIRCGATHIVTAPGTGAAALGRALAQGWSGRANAILRLPPPPPDLPRARLGDWLDIVLLGACRDLALPRIHTAVIAPPAGARGAALIEHLMRRSGDGWLRHVGVAPDTPAAARRWIKQDGVDHIELACGPGDFAARGLASALAARPDTMLVARPRPGTPDQALVAACLGQPWAQGVAVGLSGVENWNRVVAAARAARLREG